MITEKSKSALASSFSTQSEKLLLEIIRQRTGIVIQKHQLEKFRAAVQSAINDFNYANTEQLTQVIRNAPLSHSTLEYIISEITVPDRSNQFSARTLLARANKTTWEHH